MTLWRTFRNDRLFAVLFGILLLCAWLPLTQTPILPFIDLQNNVGGASMIYEAATGGPMATYYQVNWNPVPYWTGYMIMAIMAQLVNTLFAAKFICGLLSLVLPLSVVRLLIAIGRSPRQGLWAFLLVWDRNLYAGWVSYLLGMAVALYTLALLIEIKDWRGALRVTFMSALVALTHIQALAFLAVAGITLVLTRRVSIKRVFQGALALSGGLVGTWPWLSRIFAKVPANTVEQAFRFNWHTPHEKMAGFYSFTFGSFGGQFDSNLPVLVFCTIFIGPILLMSLPRKMPDSPLWPPMLVTLSCFVLYLILPFQFTGPIEHKHTYVRYGTFILLGMLLIPRPRLQGTSAWVLAPGIIMALLLDLHVARQLRDVSKRTTPYLDIIANITPHSRILPVVLEIGDPACYMAPYNQFHSYATGMTRSYDPLYFNNPSTPIIYKSAARLPYPGQKSLDYEHHIRYYDYVLVQGLAKDPFRNQLSSAPVRLVKEAGMWRLYAVNKP